MALKLNPEPLFAKPDYAAKRIIDFTDAAEKYIRGYSGKISTYIRLIPKVDAEYQFPVGRPWGSQSASGSLIPCSRTG